MSLGDHACMRDTIALDLWSELIFSCTGSLVKAEIIQHWVSGQSRDNTELGLGSKQGYFSTGSLIKAIQNTIALGLLSKRRQYSIGSLIKARIPQHWVSDQSRDNITLGL